MCFNLKIKVKTLFSGIVDKGMKFHIPEDESFCFSIATNINQRNWAFYGALTCNTNKNASKNDRV